MKKLILFLLILSGFLIQSCAPNTYRIKSGVDTDYIIPPKIGSILKSNKSLKPKYNFFNIEINNLNKSYYECVKNINAAQLTHSKNPIFIGDSNPVGDFTVVSSNDSSINVLINFQELFAQDDINKYFDGFAKDLLIEICKLEEVNDWPKSISQNIVEKVFELIPIPQEASLARYFWKVTDTSSILLLNPKISLNVEISSLSSTTSNRPPGDHWYYTFLSQTKLRFYRNNSGHIRQLPFILFNESTTMPSNSFIGKSDTERKDKKTLLLNNSGDIQLSQNSKGHNYIALFQNYMKQNSSYSTSGSDDDNLSLQTNRYVGNSILLLNSKLELLLKGIEEQTNLKAAYNSQGYNFQDEKYSRTLITPEIDVFLDNYPITIKIGSSISSFNQQFNFGRKFTLYRISNGAYVKVKNPLMSTILLPGDKIIF